tara:strand:- start:1268 stop:1543 length:276 start_codon:yes stop_codon:yes gene_type:complete
MNMSDKPYVEEKLDSNTYIRIFKSETSQSELEWHLDEQDRLVEVLNNTGNWQFQVDNELPFKLENKLHIPKETYHRLIKGEGNLLLKITNL